MSDTLQAPVTAGAGYRHPARQKALAPYLEKLRGWLTSVADSDPESEFQECLNKAGALIQAIDLSREGIE